MNLKKEKRVALLAAKKAAKVLLSHYGKKERIKEKSNKSLVGTADLKANKVIIKTIKKYFPSHNILSEESAPENNNSDFEWIIDPLDGTHNFLHEIPVFGVSIALAYKNEVVLGVLNFPILCITAIAEKFKGALLNGKKIKVSSRKSLDHAFVGAEFAYANRKEKLGFLENLMHRPVDIRNFGSAIYSLLLVACGKMDGHVLFSTHPWDVAAAFLIIEEAGGRVSDINDNSYTLQQSKFIVSNGKLHKELLKYIK